MSGLKSQSIYRSLRERILSNDIAPGARLVLREISNHYETSDIPVREALRMLERDGLVEIAAFRGARVTTLTDREIRETYFVRGHLESIATGLAAENITDERLEDLEELMVQMRAAVVNQDGAKFSEINHRFHETIVEASGNELLYQLTMDIWQRHSGFQRVFRMVPERLAQSQDEHEEIMDALKARDASRAADLAMAHKRSVGQSVEKLLDDSYDG
ncbi:GntR family transcriptional regulator [Nocardiopsis oceani]